MTEKSPSDRSKISRREPRSNLPTVPDKKVTEERSRNLFKEAISPWLVTDITHDYGIDCLVEIAKPHVNGTDHSATGKRFAVQLKASGQVKKLDRFHDVRVKPEHVRYWIGSTEPVLLVFCHIRSKRFYIRWIDDQLIREMTQRNASWMIDDSVSVTVAEANLRDVTELENIDKIVREHRKNSMPLLMPGTYAKLHAEVSNIAENILSFARESGFQSVVSRLQSLTKALRTNTYVVAVAGPARAGKSTLLNTLLGLQISPVSQLPTTAVSLLVLGSDKNEVEIIFEDGGREKGPATADFIRSYATQEENSDNHKKVQRIVIQLVNEFLERGLAYVDAPGLYDPSQAIQQITEKALSAAHAILYVIDVSPMLHGGFSLPDHVVKDLRALSASHEHLFLILNKADVLSDDLRSQLFQYLTAELKKYGVLDKLAHPPIFLSAKEAWQWREGGSVGDPPHKVLDDALWAFLLKNNTTGMNRLLESTTELRRASGDFLTILNARRLKGERAFNLQNLLNACRAKKTELDFKIEFRVSAEKKAVRDEIEWERQKLISELKSNLSNIPQNQKLPTSQYIQEMVKKRLLDLANQTWIALEGRSRNFAALVSIEVERVLQQTRLAGGLTESIKIMLPDVPLLDLSKTESFEDAWASAAFGALGFFLAPEIGLIMTVGSFLVALFIGAEARRKRQVEKIIKATESSLEPLYRSLIHQIEQKIHVFGQGLLNRVEDRIGVFSNEAETQLGDLGEALRPVDQLEVSRVEEKLSLALASIIEIELQVNPSLDSVN